MDRVKAEGQGTKAKRITAVALLTTQVLVPSIVWAQQAPPAPSTPVQTMAIESAMRLQIQDLEQQLATLKNRTDAPAPATAATTTLAPTPTAAPATPPAPETATLADPPKAVPAPNSIEALEARIEELERELAAMRQEQEEQKPRVEALEKKAALDRINFSGDIRITGDTLHGTQTQYYDGLKIQNGMVNTMFYMMTNNGAFPMPGPGQSIYTCTQGSLRAWLDRSALGARTWALVEH